MSRFARSALLLFGAAVVLPGCDDAEDHAPCDNWSYEMGACGPPWDEDEAWHECAIGDDQSPVDIRDAVADPALAALDVHYDPVDAPVLHNNGHTLQVDYPGGTLRLGERTLESLQFHVHVPAEHAVDGVRAAMELHIVHADADGNPAAVVALRFDPGAESPLLAQAWSELPASGAQVEVAGALDLASLLPPAPAYWTYSGSLTTPPCSEGLRWFVLEQLGTASQAQIDMLHAQFGDNARALQPINNRPIAERRP
jgi:carbonic anhydrase